MKELILPIVVWVILVTVLVASGFALGVVVTKTSAISAGVAYYSYNATNGTATFTWKECK